ncbi:MAG TPA: hypothetical protein PLM93_03145 [Sulfuricurvum sp.]|nr:MAG: hypothetical protein B7Y30_02520 [Campylobacterales bacterium 16-40-21]OZA04161.1 MAG: hypothetical protein B7X89_00995 [Sulfuricurvum sp. 17-40-25]HQS66170.1 hypothetical protein [Sulfuricurvum sp.]HQT35534.1 hypothetical protein [Sulfuricurvum sp.]
MRRFAYWLFPIIAIIVAVFIVAFMIDINPAIPTIGQGTDLDKDSQPILSEEDSPGWIKHFNISNEKEYFYPVNEVTIVLDDAQSPVKARQYHLVIPLKDSYEFFCLKQELKNSNLPYLLNQDGEEMTALIDSTDQTKLTALVAKLKTYQISATLSSFKED